MEGIRRNLDTAEDVEFWSAMDEVRKKIEWWPKWKRNYRTTKYFTGFEEIATEKLECPEKLKTQCKITNSVCTEDNAVCPHFEWLKKRRDS